MSIIHSETNNLSAATCSQEVAVSQTRDSSSKVDLTVGCAWHTTECAISNSSV